MDGYDLNLQNLSRVLALCFVYTRGDFRNPVVIAVYANKSCVSSTKCRPLCYRERGLLDDIQFS